MKFIPTPLEGAYVIELTPLVDDRGTFARTFCKDEFKQIGHQSEFVQFNQSINPKQGTLRGMHYQLPPVAEIKLIRCVSGSVYDVVIDLRKNSPTFLQTFGKEISSENLTMMYVPKGFAHGFLTLTDNAVLLYHHTEFYTPSADRGIRYSDPMLNIEWPGDIIVVSEKDKNYSLIDQNFSGVDLNADI